MITSRAGGILEALAGKARQAPPGCGCGRAGSGRLPRLLGVPEPVLKCGGKCWVEALAEPIGAFQPDCILLGGSIAKSMDLFTAPIRKGA